MKNFIFFIFYFFCITVVPAQTKLLSANSEISVLTCGTSDAAHALYGHTAIWVKDPLKGIDRVYNYGMFDFNTPNFTAKFVKGNLLYYVDYTTFERFVSSYIYEDRSVYLQELNLTLQQKQEVFDILNTAILPQNKTFLYEFIQQNCTTKVVDVLQEATGVKLDTNVTLNQGSYRDILSSYVKTKYLDDLGINILLGKKTDLPSSSVFLPFILQESLAHTFIDGVALAKQNQLIYQSTSLNNTTSFYTSAWFFNAIVLVIAIFSWISIKLRKTIYFIYGVFGVFLLGLSIYSSHSEFALNSSILLFNPVFILLAVFRNNNKVNKALYAILGLCLFAYVGVNLFSLKLILTLGLFLLTLVSLIKDYCFIFPPRKTHS